MMILLKINFVFTTFKNNMIRILLILLSLPMLFSCGQESREYNAFIGEKEKKIVQLVKKDDINKIAYLARFKGIKKDSIFMMSKAIAQFYDIEGYDMFFGDSSNFFISEELKNEMGKEFRNFEQTHFKVLSNIHITPYQYRTEYINKGDTIAKIIKRSELDGRKAAILTNKEYIRRDTTLLLEAIKYLNADEVYIFDSIPSKLYVVDEDLINAYSYYRGFTNEFFFWNEASDDENKFVINGAHVRNVRDDRLYTKYWTNRFLTNKEILQIKQEKISSKWKTVVYFYIPYEYDKDYASIHYNKDRKEYTIFMFNEKKTYTYNVSKDSWNSYSH